MSFFKKAFTVQTLIQTDEEVQQFTATEGQSKFTISKEYLTIRRVIVGGVEQFKPSFVESAGNSFTLSNGVANGTSVVVIFVVAVV